MSDPKKGAAPRIAIKFGAPKPSSNLKKPTSKPNLSSTLGKRPRSGNAWGGGSDSEDDDEGRGRLEKITGFGAEGAETERKRNEEAAKKEYIIARQPNRDWRAEVKAQRKGKQSTPAESGAHGKGNDTETEPADHEKGIKWGLTVKTKSAEDEQPTKESDPEPESKESAPVVRTVDEHAMDALLGNEQDEEKVIHPTEEDAYLRDVKEAGEASTLDDYEAMPVEEFGAALLRGMGWDGKPRGAKVKEVKRRPNQLGLGAKELDQAEDLGGWNQNGKKNRRPRLDEYRREESKRKDGRRHEDSYKRERERERERDRDRGSGRHRSYDRDRTSDRSRDHYQDHRRDHDRDRRR